jgi:hypothetical protein
VGGFSYACRSPAAVACLSTVPRHLTLKLPACSWPELREFMAARGYAAVVQMRAAASGNDFMLALFYRSSKLQLAWTEERSRALLVALQVTAAGSAQGQVTGWPACSAPVPQYRPTTRSRHAASAAEGCIVCRSRPLP